MPGSTFAVYLSFSKSSIISLVSITAGLNLKDYLIYLLIFISPLTSLLFLKTRKASDPVTLVWSDDLGSGLKTGWFTRSPVMIYLRWTPSFFAGAYSWLFSYISYSPSSSGSCWSILTGFFFSYFSIPSNSLTSISITCSSGLAYLKMTSPTSIRSSPVVC